MNQKISTIISYSTLDSKFLGSCVKGILDISEEVIISYSNKRWDGSNEDLEILNNDIERFSSEKVNFIEYFATEKHEQIQRQNGYNRSKKNSNFYLFIDVDEVFDHEKLKSWINNSDLDSYDAYNFECYWYFRDYKYRALTKEYAGLLIRNDFLTETTFLEKNGQRWGVLDSIEKRIYRIKFDNFPFLHHYSWVRNKEEMLMKVSGWMHQNEKDWNSLIEEEFSREFNGTDFVHKYSYEII